jgi:hypothetical protein
LPDKSDPDLSRTAPFHRVGFPDDPGKGSDDSSKCTDDKGKGSDDPGKGSDDPGKGSDDPGKGSDHPCKGPDDSSKGPDDSSNQRELYFCKLRPKFQISNSKGACCMLRVASYELREHIRLAAQH